MKQISVQAFKEVIGAESSNRSVDFINVCTPAEYKESHIKGVRSLPLDELPKRADELKDKTTVYVHCRSGRRGEQAITQLRELGVKADLVNVAGGLMAWTEAGFETDSLAGNRMPIMRQVLLIAGGLVLLGFILSEIVTPQFIWLSAVVGAGLTFAGLTGWCGMTFVLAKMPWNR